MTLSKSVNFSEPVFDYGWGVVEKPGLSLRPDLLGLLSRPRATGENVLLCCADRSSFFMLLIFLSFASHDFPEILV